MMTAHETEGDFCFQETAHLVRRAMVDAAFDALRDFDLTPHQRVRAIIGGASAATCCLLVICLEEDERRSTLLNVMATMPDHLRVAADAYIGSKVH